MSDWQVGDVVVVEGFHANYRPTIRVIGSDGYALVRTSPGEPMRVHLSKLRKPPPPKKPNKRKRYA